ncbi:TetR/AcrR family transcriptional regulator [Beijerinckia sp. L45]|uniref:TetR/AcrR family transcriptional regulator n=1 Tax=Beijerinckia sp. L45 TaxID=1641855 RepID=UPI00131AA38C|nr:TetR/AcrR family transcriptional regulator [Beijerinckia sp. L45]
MPVPPSALLKPRKTPRQARSSATVDAIFEATIQVLLVDGQTKLTTTRVAERAGVSVGTLYQYFPDKKSLLYAMLQQRLDGVPQAMEIAADQLAGNTLTVISDGLVSAWLAAKTRDIATSRALYAVAADLEIANLLNKGSTRIRAAIERVLISARDATFENAPSVADILVAILGGTVRSVIEGGAGPNLLATLRAELPLLCRAYLSVKARSVA